ncbi:MAG: hypothetical protein J1E98_11840 [Lachnospiraceae bacterium]|nr:hypothetical protein [Lachnospiraceae bacterium]
MQKKSTMQFAVVKGKDGIIQQIGRSAILQPKPNFKGGSIKWYQDQLKQKAN